jgi:hypothetical protein
VACAVVAALLLAIPPVLLIAAIRQYDWEHRREYAALQDFQRIQTGMTRDQVADLLGSPGEEVSIDFIPRHPQDTRLPGAPPGWTGVVWGDTVLYWHFGQLTIWVAFIDGRVNSKADWLPSF